MEALGGGRGRRCAGRRAVPPLLTKGILYSLLTSPKVTWLHHCATLPLPFSYPELLRSLGAQRDRARAYPLDSLILKPLMSPLPTLPPQTSQEKGSLTPRGIPKLITSPHADSYNEGRLPPL